MKKVKSIVMKVLAMMGENEVRAWGIGIKLYKCHHFNQQRKDNIMKKLKEIIKTGLIDMGNGALRAWGYEIK